MKKNIKPTGLKGKEHMGRIKDLMGITESTKDTGNSVVELTKMGPDGKAYAIVRENQEYYIKVSDKTSGLVVEDFQYIGGLQNKKSMAFPSYSKATKQLNLKFISLHEVHGGERGNILKDDGLLTEHHPTSADQKLSATKGMGDADEYVTDKKGEKLDYDAKEDKETSGDNVAEKDVEDEVEEVKLSENESAIDSMITGEEAEEINETEEAKPKGISLKISKAIQLEESEDRISEMLDSLSDDELKELQEVLKKKA